MPSHQESTFDLVAIGEMADITKQIIAFSLREGEPSADHARQLENVEQMIYQQARDYLGTVREGFVLSVRTASVGDAAELRFLLERVLLDWDQLTADLDLDLGDGEFADDELPVERVRNQLLAFGMAAIALGMLPRLPVDEITFPRNLRRPPSYADIPVPRGPGEMLERIEELERMIWQIAAHGAADLVHSRYNSLRRTYGFFESSAWLAGRQAEQFGVGRRRPL